MNKNVESVAERKKKALRENLKKRKAQLRDLSGEGDKELSLRQTAIKQPKTADD